MNVFAKTGGYGIQRASSVCSTAQQSPTPTKAPQSDCPSAFASIHIFGIGTRRTAKSTASMGTSLAASQRIYADASSSSPGTAPREIAKSIVQQ